MIITTSTVKVYFHGYDAVPNNGPGCFDSVFGHYRGAHVKALNHDLKHPELDDQGVVIVEDIDSIQIAKMLETDIANKLRSIGCTPEAL